jgi:hypothetical protein
MQHKRVFTSLVFLFSSTLLVACGGSSNPPSDDSPTTPSTGGTGGGSTNNGGTTPLGSGGSNLPTASGGSGGSTTPTVQAPACGAGDALAADADVISNFEDAFGTLATGKGLSGGWYTYKDNTAAGMITPAVGVSPISAEEIKGGGRCMGGNSEFALHVLGGGFDDWGAGTGTDLSFQPPEANAPVGTMGKRVGFDASAYTGIAFWAKLGDTPGAAPGVRLNVKDIQTDPDGMMCSTAMPSGAMACHDDFGKNIALTSQWKKFTVLFAEMAQQNFGKKYEAIKKDALFAIQFQFSKSSKFDIWLDDMHFIK